MDHLPISARAAFVDPVPLPPSDERVAAVWRDRLRLLLDSTGEGIYGVDTEGLCSFINPAAARMLGYEPFEVLGRNMHELSHHTHPDGEHYPVEHCPIFHAFRAGVACRIDSDVLWRKDGTAFPVEYTSYPILDGGQVLGAVVTFVDISERKRQEQLLRQSNETLERRVTERTQALTQAVNQLRELQAHIERVREGERTRIAREIHDELGSLLVGMKMDLSWLEKRLGDQPELRCKCQSMRGLIDNAVHNVGRIITDLRPSILDHQGLWATLEWQVQDFIDSSELPCEVSIDVPEHLVAPEGPLATAVFRIFQEMLSNVARHAQATQVWVDVQTQPHWCVRVRDNGCGFDVQAGPPDSTHVGLSIMRERAQRIGADLCCESGPDGTLIELRLPNLVASRSGGPITQPGALTS